MLTETIAIQVEGSLPGARLCIYIQEKSRELRIKERPLILLCQEEDTNGPQTGRRSRW